MYDCNTYSGVLSNYNLKYAVYCLITLWCTSIVQKYVPKEASVCLVELRHMHYDIVLPLGVSRNITV